MNSTSLDAASVCKSPDEWVPELRWVATLSNGEHIYQDDDRPNTFPASAWLRLKDYVYANDLKVINLELQFRSHIEHINPDPSFVPDGYYFSKSVAAVLFSSGSMNHYTVGMIEGENIAVGLWRVPELIMEHSEIRVWKPNLDMFCLWNVSHE